MKTGRQAIRGGAGSGEEAGPMQPVTDDPGEGGRPSPETPGDRLILSLIQRHADATRADLTKASCLTQQSVSRIVDRLVRRDLVGIGSSVRNGRGQPSPIIRINPDAAFSLGLSVTADGVALTALNLAGGVIAEDISTIDSPTPADVIALIRRFIAAQAAQGLDMARLAGLGIGITGYFVGDGSQVNPPALDDWAFVEIDRVFRDALQMPVWVENDGTAAAVGESLLGYGREVDDFAYLHFATGFGGGMIRNGQPMRGVNGNAGEFGGMLPPEYLSPSLGNLMRMVNEAEGLSYRTLRQFLADFGLHWTGVSAWLEQAGRSLTMIVNGIHAAVDPGLIVLGGRLPEALAAPLIDRIRLYSPERRGFQRKAPALRFAASPRDPVAIGAATLPLRALYF